MAEHTPGPWIAHWHYIGTDEADSQTIAYVDNHRSRTRSDEEHLANAYLIAASPKLLEELESFVRRWTKFPNPPTGRDLDFYIESAQAVIAKARGH